MNKKTKPLDGCLVADGAGRAHGARAASREREREHEARREEDSVACVEREGIRFSIPGRGARLGGEGIHGAIRWGPGRPEGRKGTPCLCLADVSAAACRVSRSAGCWRSAMDGKPHTCEGTSGLLRSGPARHGGPYCPLMTEIETSSCHINSGGSRILDFFFAGRLYCQFWSC